MDRFGTTDASVQAFMALLGDACLLITDCTHVDAANGIAERLYGVDSGGLSGRKLADLCADECRGLVQSELSRCNGTAREFMAVQRRSDGTTFTGSFSAKRVAAKDGESYAMVLVRELEKHTTCMEDLEMHSLVMSNVLDGMIAHTLDGELLYANQAAQSQWGADIATIQARGPWGWVSPQAQAHTHERVARLVELGELTFDSFGPPSKPNGPPTSIEINSRLVHSSRGPIIVSSMRDVSDRVQTEEMVRYLAYHDTLTGLANRVLLEQDLAHELALSDRHGDLLGVLFVDLDHFKPVNDTYGHAIGDDVLREIADRISGCVRETDTVARLGGDEFVVLLPRLASAEAINAVAAHIAEEVERPIKVGAHQVSVSCTIGCAVRDAGENAESLLTRADLAMYRAREVSSSAR